MAEKSTPRQTADPWDDSVNQQERQGKLRETHEKKRFQSEKNARRRDDKERKAERKQEQAGGSKVKTHRENG